MNIILTGFMGTGKSSVGKILARECGLEFLDLDDIIETASGASIKEIFNSGGETEFRRLEAEAIEKVVSGAYGANCVLATGGGAVLRKSNRDALRRWGTVVLLTASVDEMLDRVGKAEARPLLSGAKRRDTIERLMAERDSAYGDCDLSVDTTGLTMAEVVARIKGFLKERGLN
ncbi:MAG: shikimate kinase [Deltaproteobacteria bacterium]|nr:shikimate kinase [Deltaproteobacteria bacterium]